jgi:predicted RNA-binding protein YlqC (UPF0109 family)
MTEETIPMKAIVVTDQAAGAVKVLGKLGFTIQAIRRAAG